jgi:hypothetical protein
MTLVFVSMFVVIFVSLAGLATRSYHEATVQIHDEVAFQIAEAGLNFGRWRLAHNNNDFETESRGVVDQFEGLLGTYEVSFEQLIEGNSTVMITSVGRAASLPEREVTLRARYGIPSLARYTSVTNADVWYTGTMRGPVHANGGIRMDGSSDSLMTSARETYACQANHGCSPSQTKPGIWGEGTTQELWEYPVPVVDYSGLTLDLLAMKEAAQAAGTYYGDSGQAGYRLVFSSDNTVSVYGVETVGSPVWSWTAETGWEYTSHDVGQQQLLEVRSVPSGGLIYVEDTVWVEGEIRDRVTVAAGVFPDNPATNVDIILNGSIDYGGVEDGSRVLGAVAQRHILIPWSGAAEITRLDGAFIAQKGRFGRRYYRNCCGTQAHAIKTSITRYGMIASNLVPVTAWLSGGNVISGFQTGESYYDPNLLYGPPPYFPTMGEYEFISWEEL